MCIEDGSMKPPQEQEEGMPTLELVLLLWTTLASEECFGMRNAAPANAKNKDILLLGKEGTMLSP